MAQYDVGRSHFLLRNYHEFLNFFESTHFLSVDYDNLIGVELDRTNAVYRTRLTKAKVIEHPAWLAAVEEDRDLLCRAARTAGPP
mgnify:CR=1 FL=1